MKNAGLAVVLSAFWTGLGQIYNGQIGKGILFMAIQFVNFWLDLCRSRAEVVRRYLYGQSVKRVAE